MNFLDNRFWVCSRRLSAAALLGLCLILGLGHSPVHGATIASDGFASKEFLVDASGAMSLTDVQKANDWKPYRGTLVQGFTAAAVWIRAQPDISKITASQERMVVRIGAPYLDDVRLFRPDKSGHHAEKRVGDTVAFSERERAVNNFAFDWEVNASPGARQDLYVRVSSTSSMIVTLELLEPKDFLADFARELLVFGVLFGFVLIITFLAASHGLLYRDSVALSFAAYQILALGMGLGVTGVANAYLFSAPQTGNHFTSIMVLLNTLAGLLFIRKLFEELNASRWALPVTNVSGAVSLGSLALFASGFERLALQANVYLAAVTVCTLLPIFLWGLTRSYRQGYRFLVPIYCLTSLSIFVVLLPLLGLQDLGRFTPYLAVLHSFAISFAFSAVLINRRSELLKASREAAYEIQKTRIEAELIRQERDNKEQFLAMLAHELRTPLSVIRLVIDGFKKDKLSELEKRQFDHVHKAVMDVNHVIERAVHADHLERGDLLLQRVACDLPELAQLALKEHANSGRVSFNLRGSLKPIQSDPLLIKTVLANLIDNAVKYSPPESPVLVTMSEVARENRIGVLTVVRNMPHHAGKPDPDKVFEKYYRSQGARRSSGSGLGLFLVSGLAKTLGGEVRYRTDLDPDGVVFEFWVPV